MNSKAIRAAIVADITAALGSGHEVRPHPIRSSGNLAGITLIGVRSTDTDWAGASTRPGNGEMSLVADVWVPMSGIDVQSAYDKLCSLVIDWGAGSLRRIIEQGPMLAPLVEWVRIDGGFTYSSVDSRAGQNVYDGELQFAVSPKN